MHKCPIYVIFETVEYIAQELQQGCWNYNLCQMLGQENKLDVFYVTESLGFRSLSPFLKTCYTS